MLCYPWHLSHIRRTADGLDGPLPERRPPRGPHKVLGVKSLVEVSALCLLMSIAARSAVHDSPAWRQSRSTGRSDPSVPSVVPPRSCRSSVRFSLRPVGRASVPAPARSHQCGDGGRRIGRLSLKPETARGTWATPALSIRLRLRWHGSIAEPHIQPRPIWRDQYLDQA